MEQDSRCSRRQDAVNRRRIKRGDQYRFECRTRYGGEGVFAYALVVKKEPGGVPVIATFSTEVTEGDLADPNLFARAHYIGGSDSDPMANGKWKWLNRLQVDGRLLLPCFLVVSYDVASQRTTYAICDPNTDEVVDRCHPDRVRGLRDQPLFANEAAVCFDTLCGIHGIKYEPTVDDYEAFEGLPDHCRKPIGDKAREAVRQLYGVDSTLGGEIVSSEPRSQPKRRTAAVSLEEVIRESTGPFIVHFSLNLASGAMGTPEERSALMCLEERIETGLMAAGLGSCQGGGCGLGVYDLSIVCADARMTVAALENMIRPSEFSPGSKVSVATLEDDEDYREILFVPRGG